MHLILGIWLRRQARSGSRSSSRSTGFTCYQKYTGLSDIPVESFIPNLQDWSGTQHAFLIFVICMAVIMLRNCFRLLTPPVALSRKPDCASGARASRRQSISESNFRAA